VRDGNDEEPLQWAAAGFTPREASGMIPHRCIAADTSVEKAEASHALGLTRLGVDRATVEALLVLGAKTRSSQSTIKRELCKADLAAK
jgi:hypothetical protein